MALDQVTAQAALLKAQINFAPSFIPAGDNSFWGQTLFPLAAVPSAFFRAEDDFTRSYGLVATTLQPVGYKYLSDGNGNVVSIDGRGGQIQISTTGTLNDETYLSLDGSTTGANDFFDLTPNSGRRLWADFRLRPSQISNDYAFFFGLFTDSLVAANALIDTTGVIVDSNYVGFRVDPALGSSVRYTHKRLGQTAVDIAAVATVDASTFNRFSLYFDGANTLRFFVNDILQPTIIDATLTSFPNIPLVPAFLLKTTSAAVKRVVVDQYVVVQGRQGTKNGTDSDRITKADT